MPIVPLDTACSPSSVSPAKDSGSPPRRPRPPTPLPTGKEETKASSDYVVGYGRPPIHTRFKPGMSGNPKGRPKGAKGLKTIAREVLTTKVVVRTASGEKKMTLMEAMMRKTADLGMRGNLRAAIESMRLYADSVPEPKEAEGSEASEDQTLTDQAILEEFKAQFLREIGG